MNPPSLYKTTIVIWSEYDPSARQYELSELAREAEQGSAYCSVMGTVELADYESDKDWDHTQFFGGEEDA